MGKENLYTCNWIFDTLIVLCDGKVVCGCDDPFGLRVLGNIQNQSLEEIWNSEKVQKIRKELNNGYSSFCGDCCIKEEVDCKEDIEQRELIQPKVLRLFLEPTVVCNLNCYNSRCGAGGEVASSRSSKKLSFDDFKSVIDQLGDGLERLNLYNYGELFVHPQAVDMVEYVKARYPSVHIFTSTNLLMLDEEKIERLVKAGMDELTASVDGCDQESYSKYRCGGDFDKVVSIFETISRKKKEYNSSVPYVNWKYILFKWNSSSDQMKKAVEVAERAGVDRLFWEITDWPLSAKSKKYQEGTRAWKKIKHETLGPGRVCNAIRSKKYLADIELPFSKKKMVVGVNSCVKVKVKNSSKVPWAEIERGVADRVFLGAQLLSSDKKVLEEHYTLTEFREVPGPGDFVEIDVILPPIKEAGKYYLDFDLTAQMVGWFAEGGSKAHLVKLEVLKDRENSTMSGERYLAKIDLPHESYTLKAGSAEKLDISVENLGKASWENVSDTGIGWVRLGIQLYDQDRNIIDTDYSRAFITSHIEKRQKDLIKADLPAVKGAGTYFLKFDMVLEGITWFERAGSTVKWMKLEVK